MNILIISLLFHTVTPGFPGQEYEKIIQQLTADKKLDTATFGSGCFWCTEAIFDQVEGVEEVVSGYSGGHVKNPSYREVCDGNTGHAEVCRILFDPAVISYKELLDVFWQTHDPTTLNRQDNDTGPQYRSVIFYHNSMQKSTAEESKDKLNNSGKYKAPVVTEISPVINFYAAEDYHQEYFSNNPGQPYCSFVIAPKVMKFKASYYRLKTN